MELLIRAAATAAIVALVLLAARRFGHRAAGVLAGLPFTTLPALASIASTGGVEPAARAAAGSVLGCCLVPLFAAAYARAARHDSRRRAACAGVAAVACGVALAGRLPLALPSAILLCGAACIAALRDLRGPGTADAARRAAPGSPVSIVCSAALVAAVSAIVAALARTTNPQFAGLLAGLPTLGLVALLRAHGDQGAACVVPFLRGYVVSTFGRALFGAVFACSAVTAGSTLAMVAATLACVTFGVAARVVDRRIASRQAGGERLLEGRHCALDRKLIVVKAR